MKCDVIIPVGPGHEGVKDRAAASVSIACSQGVGPFDDVRIKMVDDMEGQMGRSGARNLAVNDSDAGWLFFLDADDLMHPDAFSCLNNVSDFDELYGLWGQIIEYHDGCYLERYQVPVIEGYHELLKHDVYLTLQMGHFVQREAALSTPFDEGMDTGEDWDYYLRLWREYRCAKRRGAYMVNCRAQHSVGPRSATGSDWREAVSGLIENAREMAA